MAEESHQTKKRPHHTWSAEEDKILVECILECWMAWKGDNGFKPGFPSHLEKLIHSKIPDCTLKANPHINSRIKQLKKTYNALSQMKDASGFGWNEKEKMIEVEKSTYDNWVKSHPNAKGLYQKPFPFYDVLGPVFGKDVATGVNAMDPDDAVQQMESNAAMFPDSGSAFDDLDSFLGDNNIETPISDTPMTENVSQESPDPSPMPSSVGHKGKKRARPNGDSMTVVADAMKDLSQTYKELVTCYKGQAEGSNKRPSLLNELQKFEGLTVQQRVQIALLIGKDSNMSETFMDGNQEERVVVVASILPYCP